MNFLFGTWNHVIPITVIKEKKEIGDVIIVDGQPYYITCVPGTITPTGKKCRHYYCVKYGVDVSKDK